MPEDETLSKERRALLKRLSGRVWSAMREELGTTGNVSPPTLWIFNDETIRFIRCRPFTRGVDATIAIAGLRLFPRRDDDWAEFWVWERNDLSVALGYGPEPFALQSLPHVYFGEMELGTQEFDAPGAVDTLFFRNTKPSLVRSPSDLPLGVRGVIFDSDGDEVMPPNENAAHAARRGLQVRH